MLIKSTFWCALIFAFVMAVLPHPSAFPGEPSDKVQHIVAFLVLTTLALFAYPRSSRRVITAGLIAFGALIEVIQSLPALNRDSSFLDWVADTGAIVFIIAISMVIQKLRNHNAN